ncbi:hypothetical protein D3C80_2169090 [compost metagenome]
MEQREGDTPGGYRHYGDFVRNRLHHSPARLQGKESNDLLLPVWHAGADSCAACSDLSVV